MSWKKYKESSGQELSGCRNWEIIALKPASQPVTDAIEPVFTASKDLPDTEHPVGDTLPQAGLP